jgi:hypothetical protein
VDLAGTCPKISLRDAQVGNLFMSLIYTQQCGSNSFDDLIELQRHAHELAARPSEWMPWNHRKILMRTAEYDGVPGRKG